MSFNSFENNAERPYIKGDLESALIEHMVLMNPRQLDRKDTFLLMSLCHGLITENDSFH